MHKINRELIGICGFAILSTAFIYSLSIFVLPEIFNWTGQRMDIRNLILILFSIVILSISGIMISAIIYLMGVATMGIQAVKSGALLLYIRKNRNGILFFVLSSVILAIFSGFIALALFSILKSNISYEKIKLIIAIAVAILTILTAPLILTETFSMMLKGGTIKNRLKYGSCTCRKNYFSVLKRILFLFLIGLGINTAGLFSSKNMAEEIILFVIRSMFGGIGMIYITKYNLEIFKSDKS